MPGFLKQFLSGKKVCVCVCVCACVRACVCVCPPKALIPTLSDHFNFMAPDAFNLLCCCIPNTESLQTITFFKLYHCTILLNRYIQGNTVSLLMINSL